MSEVEVPPPEVTKIREDRYRWAWPDGDGPEFEAGWEPRRYQARALWITATFSPDEDGGALLSVGVFARKVKKDGTLSMVKAYIPYNFHGFDDQVRRWRDGAERVGDQA